MSFDWKSKEVIDILSDNSLTLSQMAKKLGYDYSYVSKKRKELGLPKLYHYIVPGQVLTNKEYKARYNAKLKENGWVPLGIRCKAKKKDHE